MTENPDIWSPIGATDNARYFLAPGAPDIVVIVPHEGSTDDGRLARQNINFQMEYARALGRSCAFIVVMERMRMQTAEARHAYAERMEPTLCYGSALVVGSALSRAMASFYLGLARTLTPTRVFESLDDAIAWCASVRSAQ